MAEPGLDLSATVLKLPHHGSRHSWSDDFMERVDLFTRDIRRVRNPSVTSPRYCRTREKSAYLSHRFGWALLCYSGRDMKSSPGLSFNRGDASGGL